MTTKPQQEAKSWFRSRTGLALLAFLAIAAFFLITEHRAHFFGVLPFVLLLSGLLLHFFHHGNHGSSHAGRKEDRKP